MLRGWASLLKVCALTSVLECPSTLKMRALFSDPIFIPDFCTRPCLRFYYAVAHLSRWWCQEKHPAKLVPRKIPRYPWAGPSVRVEGVHESKGRILSYGQVSRRFCWFENLLFTIQMVTLYYYVTILYGEQKIFKYRVVQKKPHKL